MVKGANKKQIKPEKIFYAKIFKIVPPLSGQDYKK